MALMMGGGNPTLLTQDSFRFRDDSPDENSDTGWVTALDERWLPTPAQLLTHFRVRIGMRAEDQDSDESQDQLRIQMSHNDSSFTNITKTSTPIQSIDSFNSSITHQMDTTQLITNNQDGDYFEDTGGNGCMIENAQLTDIFQWDLDPGSPDPQYLELEQILQVKPGFVFGRGDNVEFRIRNASGSTLNGGYEKVPVMVMQEPSVFIKGRELRVQGKELSVK